MSLENSAVWVRDSLVPKMLSEVPKFKGKTLKDCQISPMGLNKDGFASLLIGVELCLSRDGKEDLYSLVVKIMFFDVKLREAFQSEKQFSNEIFLYSKLLPLFESIAGGNVDVESLAPVYYYASMRPGTGCSEEDGVIVMENLKPQGYRLGDRISLDLDHCVLALKQLGRFHALSYALKHLQRDTFFLEVVPKVQETLLIADFCSSIKGYNRRVADVMKALSPENSLLETLESKITDQKVFESLIAPKEPLAVLCHGDFCRNNMLFNYDEHDKPCDVKILDFQTIRYASPAIDLSFFLFMNATAQLRKQYWDQLFEAYHSELTTSLAKILGKSVESLDPCYSLQSFKEDFRQHAIYGYIIVVTFLPCMMGTDEEREELVRNCQEESSYVATGDIIHTVGGAKATEALLAIVQEMREKSYL